MATINSTPRPTTNNPNSQQVIATTPIVSVAVDKTVQGASGDRPEVYNVRSKAIGHEIAKSNLAQLGTLYADEQKHLGEFFS